MKASQIVEVLEMLCPTQYSCDWDNVGMHVGRFDNEISKILVCVDIDDEVVQTAIDNNINMIISHHPLIFKGIKQINERDFIGRKILTLAENHINAYCMHTNYDSIGGMGQNAANRLDLFNTETLEEIFNGEGIGKIGELNDSLTVIELCEKVKEKFNLDKVILYGDEQSAVSRVAIVPGSGHDEINLAINKGAEVLITGDITYHYGIDSVAKGLCIIDAGHYGIEHIFIDDVSNYLTKHLDNVEVFRMKINNPQKFI